MDEDLGDVRIGDLEGKTLDDYRDAPAHSNRKERFPGGESLDEAALRYAGAFGRLLARDEPATLVVCHEIPVRYLVNAAAGSDELNGPLKFVTNATPYLFDEPTLRPRRRAHPRAGGLTATCPSPACPRLGSSAPESRTGPRA